MYIFAVYTPNMDSTKLFKSGNSQAIRIPKKFQLRTKEAYITRVGNALVIYPKYKGWKNFFDSIEMFTDDFPTDIPDALPQKREAVFK